MKVCEIMTDPALTCTPDMSLAAAAGVMRESDCGTLPVVDSRGSLAGIITDRDICLAVAGSHRSAINMTVHEAMTQKVVSARVDDEARDALAAMKTARVRRLPVQDDHGRVKGLISIEDVVVRGLQSRAVKADEICDALRTMYVRTPAVTGFDESESEFTPG